MSKKLGGVLALAALCALSLFLLNCGSSSSRPSGVLYVLTQGSSGEGNNVTSFSMDLNTGNLSLINSNPSTCPPDVSSCGLPLDIVLDPTGATAYVLNQGDPTVPAAPTISSYSVNSDGSLSSSALAATLTGVRPLAMMQDATGQFLFVIDQGSSPPPGYPVPTQGNPSCPHAPTGLADVCPSISVYAMQSGSLTLQSGSPVYTSKIPSALSPIVFTPAGSSTSQELLFVTNNLDICTSTCVLPPHSDNTVSEYTVSSSGVLSEQTLSPYIVAVTDPVSVLAVNTTSSNSNGGGVFVYVGNTDQNGGGLSPYQVCTVIGNGGCNAQQVQENLIAPLVQPCSQPPCNNVPPSTVGKNPIQMVVDPTNNFLYSVSQGSNQVYGFTINTTAGTLTALSPANEPTGAQPVSLALHPTVNNTGQFLYVSNNASSNITGFTLSPTTGSMGNPITVVSPAAPSGIAVH